MCASVARTAEKMLRPVTLEATVLNVGTDEDQSELEARAQNETVPGSVSLAGRFETQRERASHWRVGGFDDSRGLYLGRPSSNT